MSMPFSLFFFLSSKSVLLNPLVYIFYRKIKPKMFISSWVRKYFFRKKVIPWKLEHACHKKICLICKTYNHLIIIWLSLISKSSWNENSPVSKWKSIYFHLSQWFSFTKIYAVIKTRPLALNGGLFCSFESACGFVNVKLVIVDLWGGVQHLQSELITL